MWKFLAMRYHSASMREYAHFHITVVKKITNFGPIFWPIFDRFLTIFVKNFNCFCARAPPNFVLFLTFFCLLCAYRFCLPNRIWICTYAHQSAYFRIICIRMAIPIVDALYVLVKTIPMSVFMLRHVVWRCSDMWTTESLYMFINNFLMDEIFTGKEVSPHSLLSSWMLTDNIDILSKFYLAVHWRISYTQSSFFSGFTPYSA